MEEVIYFSRTGDNENVQFFTGITPTDSVYSDRLYQWDYKKFNECCETVWGNSGQMFDGRESKDIEKFLQLYFGKEEVVLCKIIKYINQSTGYPYWRFDFTTQEKYKFDFEHNDSMEKIFNEAKRIAESGHRWLAMEFKDQYVTYVCRKNEIDDFSATLMVNDNLGYFAGYFSVETRRLIKEYYDAEHPIFGNHYEDLTPEMAFEMGKKMAQKQ